MVDDWRRGGVKYSEKVLCKRSGTHSFFIEGVDMFLLRTAATEDVGSICVDERESDGD